MKVVFWFVAGNEITARELVEVQKFFNMDRLDIGRRTFIIGTRVLDEPTMEQIELITTALTELKVKGKAENYGFVIDSFMDKRKVLNDIMSSIQVDSNRSMEMAKISG